MSNKPPISWSAALRSLKDDRTKPSLVREERLRSTAGLRGSPALALSAWRGKSGRRYVVGIQPLAADAVIDACASVVIAVRRDEVGIAKIVSVASGIAIGSRVEVEAWVEAARASGGNELHVHRLAQTAFERADIVLDLADDASSSIDLSVEA